MTMTADETATDPLLTLTQLAERWGLGPRQVDHLLKIESVDLPPDVVRVNLRLWALSSVVHYEAMNGAPVPRKRGRPFAVQPLISQ